MYNFTEADASNLMVRQKDAILHLVNAGEYDQAQVALTIVDELWCRFDYAYKVREIRERIVRERKNHGT